MESIYSFDTLGHYIRIETMEKKFLAGEVVEEVVRNIATSCDMQILGEWKRKRIKKLKDGELAQRCRIDKPSMTDLVFSLDPSVSCSLIWNDQVAFQVFRYDFRVALCFWLHKDILWDKAEELFLTSIKLLEPTWGELNDVAVTRDCMPIGHAAKFE